VSRSNFAHLEDLAQCYHATVIFLQVLELPWLVSGHRNIFLAFEPQILNGGMEKQRPIGKFSDQFCASQSLKAHLIAGSNRAAAAVSGLAQSVGPVQTVIALVMLKEVRHAANNSEEPAGEVSGRQLVPPSSLNG
jgi:hypothetical protein